MFFFRFFCDFFLFLSRFFDQAGRPVHGGYER